MQFPRIHMNGTSGPELLKQYVAAVEAVQAAIHAVRAIEVHGRDYYTINSEAASTAHHEHLVRIGKLDGVREELERIAVDVHDQIHGKPV